MRWLMPITTVSARERIEARGPLVMVYGEMRRDPEKRKEQMRAAARRYKAKIRGAA